MEISQTSVTPGWDGRHWSLIAGIALAALLLFIWPIPHTISLRELLLVVSFGWFAYLAYRSGWREPMRSGVVRVLGGVYLLLSVWIVFVAIAVSEETTWSLGEIRGQWLKATIALVAGGLLGAAIWKNHKMVRLALIVMSAVLLLHLLYVVYQVLGGWFPQSVLMKRVAGLTGGPDKSNYLTNMLIYFLFAEIFFRVVFQRRLLPVSNLLLTAISTSALFAVYVQTVRNGIAELAAVLGLFVILAIRESNRRRRRIIAISAIVLVGVALFLGYLNARTDGRWRTFVETVPIALDIESNTGWIKEGMPQPRLASGETVDWSNYSRIARIRAGLSLMAERPLGVGFGRNAFGHAVEKKYGIRTAHSHSGIIDLGVGVGVLGVALWLVFLGTLLRLGYRGLRKSHSFPALVLLFLTTGYSFRMLVDSTIRDHMLQMFLFLAAFLAVIVANRLHGRQQMTSSPA